MKDIEGPGRGLGGVFNGPGVCGMFWGAQNSVGRSTQTRKSIGVPGGLLGNSGRGTPNSVGVGLTCLLHLHKADVAPGGSGDPPPLRALGGGGEGIMGPSETPPKPPKIPHASLPASHWSLVGRQFTHFLDYNSRKTVGPRRTPIEPGLRFPSCPAARERPLGAGTVP